LTGGLIRCLLVKEVKRELLGDFYQHISADDAWKKYNFNSLHSRKFVIKAMKQAV